MVRVYAAEIGTVGFVSVGILVLLVTLAESVRPGTAANYLSPQSLIVIGIGFGLLSLVARIHGERSRRQRIVYDAVMIMVFLTAFRVAWRYFEAIPDIRWWLSILSAGTVALLFLSYRNVTEPEDEV